MASVTRISRLTEKQCAGSAMYKAFRVVASTSGALISVPLMFGVAERVWASAVKTPYPAMVPVNEYLIADEGAEVVLARSAAPKSISGGVEVMVLGQHGYKIEVKGQNGFVCVVFRSWAAGIDDPVFRDPKLRADLL